MKKNFEQLSEKEIDQLDEKPFEPEKEPEKQPEKLSKELQQYQKQGQEIINSYRRFL